MARMEAASTAAPLDAAQETREQGSFCNHLGSNRPSMLALLDVGLRVLPFGAKHLFEGEALLGGSPFGPRGFSGRIASPRSRRLQHSLPA